MIRNFRNIITTSLFILLVINSCSFLKEVAAFGKCEFRTTTLEQPEIAGVDVSRINSFGDIGFADMAVITASVMKGDLPLDFILNIETRNPNPATAALNRLEYRVYIDDAEIAAGSVNDRIEIPANGGVSTIPLKLHTDLIELMRGESRQAIVNFGLNLADASNRPTRVSVKVKPTINIGGVEIVYPGYFTLKYDFASGDN